MLKIDGVQKKYDGFHLEVSFEMPEGRISGLIGRNGSGKSTIFKSILNLIKIDAGKIIYRGKDISKITSEEKEDFGIALADSVFSRHLTVKQIRRLCKGFYQNFDQELFDQMLQKMQLPLNKKVKEFSTGMQAKLRLLVAISHQPKFLLLDEPTAGLDVIARQEILDFIRDYMIMNEEVSMIISSHIASDLEGLCDDLYFLQDGRIIFHEETDALLSNYGIIKVTEEEWESLDKNFIQKYQRESFGYKLLTNEKLYYMENYPKLVIEKAGIDELISMLDKGENL